jgi:hypothetical protein
LRARGKGGKERKGKEGKERSGKIGREMDGWEDGGCGFGLAFAVWIVRFL